MKLVKFTPVKSESQLAGFATIELEAVGLRFIDMPVFGSGRHGPWVGLPQKPALGADKRPLTGSDGKPLYDPCAAWTDRKFADSFSRQAIGLIRQKYPNALPPE
jgi:hypothetical protein